MKRMYEEPTMETLIIDGTVIVSISGEDTEPEGGSNSGTFDEILGGF